MIVGIGNDIIEIKRIEKAIIKTKFLEKYFTVNEIKLFKKRSFNVETIAGNFAVKESVSKVLGKGIGEIYLSDIEVLRDSLGKPYVILYNAAKRISETKNIANVHVSISHSKKYVIAMAIGESRETNESS